jgi:single-stranded DNA-binding protein
MNGSIITHIVGTIASDPKPYYKVNSEELAGCDFSVAINQSKYVNGTWINTPTFLYVNSGTAYRAQELIKSAWCKKGRHIYVVCHQKEESWIDKTGNKRSKQTYTYLYAQPILTGNDSSSQKSNPHPLQQPKPQYQQQTFAEPAQPQAPASDPTMSMDDIPF